MRKLFSEKFQRNVSIWHWSGARQKRCSSKVNRFSRRRQTVLIRVSSMLGTPRYT